MGTVHSGQLQDRYNMAKFLILSACLALSAAAPSQLLGALAPAGAVGLAGAGYAGVGLAGAGHVAYGAPAVVGQQVIPGPTHVQEHVHAGPAVAHHRTINGVVGHRQVQVGTQTVQVGHQYAQTGESAAPRAAYTEIAAPATNSASVRAIPAPALPAPAPPAAIPPPAAAWGPAPADAVTTYAVDAPVRTHTKITPRLHRIEPELQVNKVPYDVPLAVPVPQPYKVHPVQQVVETPIIHKKTVSVHQPVVHTAVQTAVHTVAAAPSVAVHAAPAVVGAYAAPAAAVGVAAAPAAAVGVAAA